MKLLRALQRRREAEAEPAIIWSPDVLPAELWLDISDLLDLVDVAALAFTCKRFMTLLANSWKELAVNRMRKLDFLRRLDESLPSMLLCTSCPKYHNWSQDKGSLHTHGQHLAITPDVKCFAENWRLVMRAQKYKDARYGLPLDSLETSHRAGQWQFETKAAVRGGGLLLRVISTWSIKEKPWGKEWKVYNNALKAYAVCACGVDSAGWRQPATGMWTIERYLWEAVWIMGSTKKHRFLAYSTGTWSNESYHMWPPHRCKTCGVFAYVELKCSRFSKYEVRITRYHDLGPVDMHQQFPLRSEIEPSQEIDWDRSYVRQEDGSLVYEGEWTEYA